VQAITTIALKCLPSQFATDYALMFPNGTLPLICDVCCHDGHWE